jgi:hypothetical protein
MATVNEEYLAKNEIDVMAFENIIKERQRLKLIRMIDIYSSHDDFKKINELTKKLKEYDTTEVESKPIVTKSKKSIIEDLISSNPGILNQKWYKIPEAIQEHLIRSYFAKLTGETQNKVQVMKEALDMFKKGLLEVTYDSTSTSLVKIFGLVNKDKKWMFETNESDSDHDSSEHSDVKPKVTKTKTTRKKTTELNTSDDVNNTTTNDEVKPVKRRGRPKSVKTTVSKTTKEELEDLL